MQKIRLHRAAPREIHASPLLSGSSRGLVQTDYIIAVGIFITIFAAMVLFTTSYLTDIRGTAQLTGITNRAFALAGAAEFGAHPPGWPEEQTTNTTVLLYHFTNNTTTANDYSRPGNNGTVANGTAWNTSGRFGGAFTFDGIDDAIDTGSLVVNPSSLNFSAAAWIYANNFSHLDTNADLATIVSQLDGTGTGRAWLFVERNTSAQFLLASNIGGTKLYGTTSLTTGSWQHVAVTYNGTLALYLNGTLEASASRTAEAATGVLRLGRHAAPSGVDEEWNGSADEVVIFNRSLSANEILNLSQPERRLDRIGLRSRAYRFWIVVNNTQAAYRNQSLGVSNLPAEYVSVNLANITSVYNIHSVNVYDPSNNTVAHQQMGTNITFTANITANTAQTYAIVFDDDGVYANRSVTVTGTDNLSETVHPYEVLGVIDYQGLRALNATNGTLAGNATGFGGFNITLYDTNSSADVFSFGTEVPRRGDVVALQRFVVFLNATGGLRPGRVTVRAW